MIQMPCLLSKRPFFNSASDLLNCYVTAPGKKKQLRGHGRSAKTKLGSEGAMPPAVIYEQKNCVLEMFFFVCRVFPWKFWFYMCFFWWGLARGSMFVKTYDIQQTYCTCVFQRLPGSCLAVWQHVGFSESFGARFNSHCVSLLENIRNQDDEDV